MSSTASERERWGRGRIPPCGVGARRRREGEEGRLRAGAGCRLQPPIVAGRMVGGGGAAAAEGAQSHPAIRAPLDPWRQNGGVAPPCGDAGAPLDTDINKFLLRSPLGRARVGGPSRGTHRGPARPRVSSAPGPWVRFGPRSRLRPPAGFYLRWEPARFRHRCFDCAFPLGASLSGFAFVRPRILCEAAGYKFHEKL